MSRSLASFVARRLAAAVAVLITVAVGVFLLLDLAPGSTERTLIGERRATPETLAAIRVKYHLDDPLMTRFGHWIAGLTRGDLGESIRTQEPVTHAVARTGAITATLALYAFVIAVAVGVTMGVASALWQRSFADRGLTALGVVGVSTPSFALGLLLLYAFALKLRWFPQFGAGNGFADRLYHLTLPAIALAVGSLALIQKITRASVGVALRQDYVTFARARGVHPLRVIGAYAVRNAVGPIVTAAGLVLSTLVVGTILVEQVFSLPGLGSLLIESVRYKDVPVVQALALLFAGAILAVSLLVDLLYPLVDPRITFDGARE